MTPVQLYNAIGSILGIDSASAELLANHFMALTLGRPTTDSSSWRTTPPAHRNDLRTSELMINRLLNNNEIEMNTLYDAVMGFDNRVTNVVGSDDDFNELGGNLIEVVIKLKNKIESLSSVGRNSIDQEELKNILSEIGLLDLKTKVPFSLDNEAPDPEITKVWMPLIK